MKLLKIVLHVDAALAAIAGVLLALVPGWVFNSVLTTPPFEHAWYRIAGIEAVTLAILMVLVARRAEELWRWAWAFVFGTAALALLALLKAILKWGVTSASPAWWIGGAVAAVLAVLLAMGIVQAGRPRSPASPRKSRRAPPSRA